MNTISERYYTLKSSGIAKRIDDATSLLKEHHLHHKGLTQSLNKLREILLVDLPALEKSLQRTRKLSWFLNFLLILIAIYIIAVIFLPGPNPFVGFTNTIEKAGFIEATMNIIVGLIVSSLSSIVWSKKKSPAKSKKYYRPRS